MNTNEAIELARKHAKLRPESYYSEPFIPHDWVIAAIIEAATPKVYSSINEDLDALLEHVLDSPCEAFIDMDKLEDIHTKIAELQGKISVKALEELSKTTQEINGYLPGQTLPVWPFTPKK